MVLLTVCDARKPVNLDGINRDGTRCLSLDNCSFTYDFYNVTDTEYVSEVFDSRRKRRDDYKGNRGIWDKVQMGRALVHKTEGSPFHGLKMTDKSEVDFLSLYYDEIKTFGDFLEFIRVVNDNHLDFNLSDDDYGFLADHIIYKYVVFIPHQGTVKIKDRYYGQGDLYGSADLADYCNDSGSIVFIKLPIQDNEDIYQYKSTTTFHGHSFGISFEPKKVKVDQLFRTLNQFSFLEKRAKNKFEPLGFYSILFDYDDGGKFYTIYDIDDIIKKSKDDRSIILDAWGTVYKKNKEEPMFIPLTAYSNLLDYKEEKMTIAKYKRIKNDKLEIKVFKTNYVSGYSTLNLLKKYYNKTPTTPKDEEEEKENPIDIKPDISPAIKILPGFYNLKDFIKIFNGALRFNNYTYKVELTRNIKMSDNLISILWGGPEGGGFLDLLGKHKNIHIICDQLAPDESIFIDETRAWRKQIMATMTMSEPIFGQRITREPDRSYRFKLQNGTHNRLTFRFADCHGNPITMNSAVEIKLWLS